jgi:hypothetical protein
VRGHQELCPGGDRVLHVGDRPDGTGPDADLFAEAGTGPADRLQRARRVEGDLQAPDPGFDEHVEYGVEVLGPAPAYDRDDAAG